MVAMVAIAGSMIYFFVFFRPGIERAEIKLQEDKNSNDLLDILLDRHGK